MTSKSKDNAQHFSVLVLEDEDVLRTLILDMLESAGYEGVGVSTCAEARERGAEGFAAGLIDLALPDGNGLSVLAELKEAAPWFVPIVLTGDIRPESIIETLRVGAFDYLTKPIDSMTLRAAMVRAIEHHTALRERDHFVKLLREEREQLKVRVEEATEDIRLYAARRNSLLRLARISTDAFRDETLFQGLFAEISPYHPLACAVLCAPGQDEFLAAVNGDGGKPRVVNAEGQLSGLEAKARHEGTVTNGQLYQWVREYTVIDPEALVSIVFPQSFWGRTVCTVAFFFDKGFRADSDCREFLGMCAHFAATEWQEARLFLHATQQASLGNIALEMSRGFIQGLTAIRTAADYVSETEVPDDAAEGLTIISENVDQLQRQIQEFGKLCTSHPNTMETVHIHQYIEQAIDLLAMAIRNRGIVIDKDYETDCPCLLLNGSTLARTFHDLLSCAVRTVEAGGRIKLSLREQKDDAVLFEMNYDRMPGPAFDRPGATMDALGAYPSFLLAQRSIRSCGGKLVFGHEREGLCSVRVVLPRNALKYGGAGDFSN